MIDYKTSNNKWYKYIFIITVSFSEYTWAIPLKNKYGETIARQFSNILTTSNRSPLKIEIDRGKEWYISFFQNFLQIKNLQHYSRCTDKGSSVAERMILAIKNLSEKPIFERRNANWLGELSSVNKQYFDTIHHSTKMTPVQASIKTNEKEVYSNLQDKREEQTPKYKLRPYEDEFTCISCGYNVIKRKHELSKFQRKE